MPDVTRIIEQKATESIYNDDWILIDRPTEGEDGGTRKILASKLKELFCGDYIADEWESLVTYNYGRFVTHEGKLYYNNSGGALVQITFNSNAWLEVRIDELLEKLIGSIGEKWRRVDTYRYDDLVVYGGRLYRCIKNASTQGTWVSNEWIEANAEYYFKKVREYIARYGFVPRREAISSPYNKGDLILYRAPGDTTNSLYMRLNDTEHGDPTWIPENWLKVENIGGALSKIYDDMEESSCDVQIKEQSIVDENNVADLTSLAAVGSVSGAIATFDDGSDLPMPSLKVAIEPQQDLHGYDSPWVGGAGKNKLQVTATTQTINGVTFTVNSDGTITLNGTSTTDVYFRLSVNMDLQISESIKYSATSTNNTLFKNFGFDKKDSSIQDTSSASFGSDITVNNPNNMNICWIHLKKGVSYSKVIVYPMIRLASVTDDTFAPYSNICPISGWDEANVTRTGKNLWGGEKLADDIVAKVPDATKDTTNHTVTYTSRNIADKILFENFKENTQYSIFINLVSGESTNLRVVYKDGTGQGIAGNIYPFITQANKSVDYIIGFWATGSTTINYLTSGLFEGVITAQDFEAYNGQTYTIDLDGTRYGGTLDVISGVLTVDRVMLALNGSENWTTDIVGNNKRRFTCTSLIDLGVNTTTTFDAISNIYVNTKSASYIDLSEVFILRYLTQYNQNRIDIMTEAYQDVESFKAFLNSTNMQIVYELATPLTIQLTPTQVKSLLGQNNVWADTGDVLDAEYTRDATTIINSLIARIEELENQ